jgi:hypothetical protein
MEQAGRSPKGQRRHADRIGALALVIFGDEIEVRDMDSGEQRRAANPDEAVELVMSALAKETPAEDAPADDAPAEDAHA